MAIYKIAQRWQRVFPFKDISQFGHSESLDSFTGTMNGSPYWSCYLCGKPVLDDLTGKPITRKEHLSGYIEGETFPEEQSNDYVFTQQEYDNIKNLFSQYIPAIHSEVNKSFNLIKDQTKNTGDIIRDLFTKLIESNREIKNITFDVLQKISPILEDKGINDEQASALLELFSDMAPYFSKFWPSYIIPQYVSSRNPSSSREASEKDFEEKKNEIINYTNNYKAILDRILNEFLKPHIGIAGAIRSKSEKKLHPICKDCFNENSYSCDECNFKSLNEDDIIFEEKTKWTQSPQTNEYKKEKINHEYCKEHGADCESCGKGLKKDGDETIVHDNQYYHSDCFSDIYSSCNECGRIEYREDMQYDEESGAAVCRDCFNEEIKAGIEQSIPEEDLDAAKNILTNQDKFFPLDVDLIQKSIIPAIQLAIKHISKNPVKPTDYYNEIESFIHKRLQKPEAKAAVSVKLQDLYSQTVISSRVREADFGYILKNMEAFFIKNAEEMNRIKTDYPNIKGFKPYPVDIKIEEGKMSHGGSVFAIYPSEEFLDYADLIQPGAKGIYDIHISNKGHHRGALAYARFTLSKGNIIIDNLQTDIDAQAFNDDLLKSKPALQWWVSTIKKFWAPYLLDALRKFGQSVEKKVYLTNFDMQKIKWRTLPERNKDIYDRIPEAMNMVTEKVLAKPEDLSEKKWDMRRVARKLTENIDEFIRLATE
jgi:hypothetical protein